MTLSELRTLTRQRLRDTVKPYLVADDEIDAAINEAQREACTRAHLLEDAETFTIDLAVGERRYDIDPRILDVLTIMIGTETPREFTEGWTLTETQLVLSQSPSSEEVLTLRCYRLPLNEMADDVDTPEIRSTYQQPMLDWALSLLYLIPDADLFDAQASERYAMRFMHAFGDRPSALTRRNQRDKRPRVVAYNGAI